MKRILLTFAALASLAPWLVFGQETPLPATNSNDSIVEQQLIKLKDGWNNALTKGDAAALDPLLTDDYMETYPHGEFENKTQCLADLKAHDLHIISAVNDQYKVRVYGDAAVVNYRAVVKGDFKGADISGQYRVTDTWIKRAGQWQCAAAHLSQIAE
jgi:ketosteroid isomerase-like protein